MVFVHCHECSARISLFDTGDKGWIESADGKWLCPNQHNGAVGRASWASSVIDDSFFDVPEPGPLKGAQHHGLGRQEPQGFEEPEDGSEERYHSDRIRLPWSTHTFWWVVHNAGFVETPVLPRAELLQRPWWKRLLPRL